MEELAAMFFQNFVGLCAAVSSEMPSTHTNVFPFYGNNGAHRVTISYDCYIFNFELIYYHAFL